MLPESFLKVAKTQLKKISFFSDKCITKFLLEGWKLFILTWKDLVTGFQYFCLYK